MKQSKLFIPTQKEVTSQAVAISHIYALKAGLIYQTAAGIYSYLPYGNMILENIKQIVNEELQNIGANLLTLPLLEPSELWEKTGRWNNYGSELFRVEDRRSSKFALAPTHEEVITDLVKNSLKSYKNFPLNLYQIGTKFRDEARPRFGLLRGREFIMMDGYSFHIDSNDLNKTYEDYYQAYKNILKRLNIEYKVVVGDNGQMGGNKSHEFMAWGDIGEDTIAVDSSSEVAYNSDIAPVHTDRIKYVKSKNKRELIKTINKKTISEVSSYLEINENKLIKSIVLKGDNEFILALVNGADEVNELKIKKLLNLDEIYIASKIEIDELGLVDGYIGPVDLDMKIISDNRLKNLVDLYCGANKKDYHLKNVDLSRDVLNIIYADIKWIKEGEKMFENGQPVIFKKSIEVGHIFALGDKYTKDLNVEYLDKNQKLNIPVMGCYGIGISRLLSAVIEQNHDSNGMILPKSIAPYDVHLIVLDYKKKDEQRIFADKLYCELKNLGFRVLLDDRDERPGIKFKESDLLAIHNQIVVGKKFIDNIVEFKTRIEQKRIHVHIDDLKGVLNG